MVIYPLAIVLVLIDDDSLQEELKTLGYNHPEQVMIQVYILVQKYMFDSYSNLIMFDRAKESLRNLGKKMMER